MFKTGLIAGAAILTLDPIGSAANAFPSRGNVTIEELQAPLPADAMKRTYDFMKRFDVPSVYESVDVNNCDESADSFRQYVIAYNDRLDRFLAGPTEPKKLKADRPLFQRGFRTLDSRIARSASSIENSGRGQAHVAEVSVEDKLCVARINRYNLLALREAVNAIGRIYPDMAEVAPALTKIDAAIAKVGDEDEMRAKIEANLIAALAEVRMPAASSQNPAWEASFKSWFNRNHPDRTYIKQHLARANWEVTRHWLSGAPIKRATGTRIASKKSNGKCYILSVIWRQDYNGSSYGGDQFFPAGEVEILCQNL